MANCTGRSVFHKVRGISCHVREWGDEKHPRIFLLHGWMDVSASFQFVVQSLRREWHVIAPDWRGFGLSDGEALANGLEEKAAEFAVQGGEG